MKSSYIRFAAVLGMVISLAPPARPQSAAISVWRVSLQSESGESLSRYSGELYDGLHRRMAAVDLGLDNTFEFRQIPCGEYLVVVRDANGEAVHQEFVSANSQQQVTIRLPKKDVPQPPAGPVSVTQLRHPPARKAVQAAMRAERFARAGEFEPAAQQFQKAIDISPDYAEAYSGLAASHLHTGNFRDAESEANRAIELSQPNPVDLCNLSQAQFRSGRIAEATATARRWLAIAPEDPKPHWVLGLLLARDRRTLAEAARHLERAAQDLPAARPQWEAVRNALAASATEASR